MRIVRWMVVALIGMGCLPKTSLEVLVPADVALPPNVTRIAVVDRSRPGNFGQGVLDTIEGALTNEDIAADRRGASEAVRGVAEVLRASPRFEVVVPRPDRRRQDSSVFDRTMNFRTAKAICQPHGCQAVVSLEAFDSDSQVLVETETSVDRTSNGREIARTTFQAMRETRVVSAWRVYDLSSRSIVDDIRDHAVIDSWTEEGPTEAAAIASLPPVGDAVFQVGFDAGASYGVRIAPSFVWVTRSYYGGGDDRMKRAKRLVKANRWPAAAEVWQGVARKGSGKIAAKARYNLAVYNETRGRLNKALRRAKAAASVLSNNRSRTYVRILERRLRDAERLERQMRPPAVRAPRRSRR
ncbi:MAG: hypothetical protein KTR31_26765 [Myxococcales bacterium]|nr:hypothetical protein [Myxococcales bacterium]